MNAENVRRREHGAATAELAIYLPLAFVLVLGSIDFGRALNQTAALTHAVHAGAKFGSHDVAHASNIAGMTATVLDDLVGSISADDVAVQAERLCECDGGAVDCTSTSCAGGLRSYVNVRAEKTFTTLFPYPGVPDAITLVREARMRVQ